MATSTGLGDAEAKKQIKQMIAFIKQEANEKADEIQVKAESEFMAEKLTLQTQASNQIREDFEKRKKDLLTEKKIQKSKKVNDIKFNTMRKRDQKMKQLKDEVTDKLADVSKNPKYPDLIRFLLIQGFMTIMEPKVIVQCREEDFQIVKDQLDTALHGFQEVISQAAGVSPPCQVVIDTKDWLPPGPSRDRSGVSCCGGVVLSARKGKIVCRNTLDHRLELSFQTLKPLVRTVLFGARPPPVNRGGTTQESGHH